MILDGKKIADEMCAALREKYLELPRVPALFVIQIGEHSASEKFIERKEKFGKSIGVPVRVRRFSSDVSEKDIFRVIEEAAVDEDIGGIVVQLPLPERFATEKILNAIPVEKDVDVLSQGALANFAEGDVRVMPPVAGAIHKIFEQENISSKNKIVVVIGKGRLVGKPAELFLKQCGARVLSVDDTVPDLARETKQADIIISGAGSPGLLTLDKIKNNVVLIDAGTSLNKDKKLSGDADPSCAAKCSLFTPVPGGVGPITVAVLFQNLFILSEKRLEK